MTIEVRKVAVRRLAYLQDLVNDPFKPLRALMLFVAIAFVPPFVVSWTYLTFYHQKLQEIPSGVLELLLAILGARILQAMGEVYIEMKRAALPLHSEPSANAQLPDLGDVQKTVERPSKDVQVVVTEPGS